MPSLEKITTDRFPEIHAELLSDWEPTLPESTWRLVFTRHWPVDEEHFGYALIHQGKPVGMIGTLFSQRQIDGRTRRFCNLHSWTVKPEFRGLSLLLMKPILALTEHAITDLTATPRVAAISKRIGLKVLDRFAYVLPPLPAAGLHSRATLNELNVDALDDDVPADVAQVCRDHAATECRHLLLREGEKICHIAFSVVDRHRLRYVAVHEVSDATLLARHHAVVRRRLLKSTGCAYVVIDSRLVEHARPPFSFRVRATEKLYRSTDLLPHQINSLYSEMVLLQHTTLPGLRDRFALWTRKQAVAGE